MAPARTADSLAKVQQIIDHFKSSHVSSDYPNGQRDSHPHLGAKKGFTGC
jgi:hypothetical protein